MAAGCMVYGTKLKSEFPLITTQRADPDGQDLELIVKTFVEFWC
jgi:hypothetical protein